MKFLDLSELEVLSKALTLSTSTLRLSTRFEAYSCKAVSKERRLFKALEHDFIADLSLSTSVSPPEQRDGLFDSPFGPLDKPESRKTLYQLINLLNVAFPDHDFSKVRPEDFTREAQGAREVLQALSSSMEGIRTPGHQRTFASYPTAAGLASFSPQSSPRPLFDSLSLPPPNGFHDYPQYDPSSWNRLGTSPSSMPNGAGPTADATNPFLKRVLDPIIDLQECEVYSYVPDIDSDPHAFSESDSEEGSSDGSEDDEDEGYAEMGGFSRRRRRNTSRGGKKWASYSSDAEEDMSIDATEGGMVWGEMDGVTVNVKTVDDEVKAGGDAAAAASNKSVPLSRVTGNTNASSSLKKRKVSSSEYYSSSYAEAEADRRGNKGLLWSCYYFLYNRKMKRILFVSSWARKA